MTIGPLIPRLGLINIGIGSPLTGPSAPTDDSAFADMMLGLKGDPQGAADQFNEGGFFANADAVATPVLAITAPSAATPTPADEAALPITSPLSAADLLAARDALPGPAALPAMAAIEGRAAIPAEMTAASSAASPFVAVSSKATAAAVALPLTPPIAPLPPSEPAAPARIDMVMLVAGSAARSPIEAKVDARDGAAVVTVTAPGLTDQEVAALHDDIVALLRRHGLVLDDLRLNGRSMPGGQDQSGN